MATSIAQQAQGTVQFDNAFRGIDPVFEAALAYHATLAVHSMPQHRWRIATAVTICQVGHIQRRAQVTMLRDGPMRWEEAAARVKAYPDASSAAIVTSAACTCGAREGTRSWPCAHRYSVELYQAASRTAEQAQYERAVA